MAISTKKTQTKTIAINPLIKNGENTHHHDQEITLDNFSPMNRITNIPIKPMPFDVGDPLDSPISQPPRRMTMAAALA